MEEKWREYFETWSRTSEYKKRLKEAKQIISNALHTFKKPYIAWSGGKDSTVLTHLVLQKNPQILVIHWDYGPYYIPKNLHTQILKNAEKMAIKNLQILTSTIYNKKGTKAQNILGRIFIGIEIPRLAKQGYDAAFIGLRAEESIKRKLKPLTEKTPSGITNIYPIHKLTWRDIWAYITTNQIPYLTTFYDKYNKLLGYHKTRFTTLFDPEFDKFGAQNIDRYLMWKHRKIH